MVEKFRSTERLPADLLTLIMKGDFREGDGYAEEDISLIEEGLGVYFPVEPGDCIGIVFHKRRASWEKPLFRSGESDQDPRVQAIAQIGQQAEYWELVGKALESGKLLLSRYTGFNLLVMHHQDDEISINTSSLDGSLR